MTAQSPMPGLLWEPAPCPQCGATNDAEAARACQQTQDETGEYSCAGEFNDAGISIQPTAGSIAILDAWIDANAERLDGECQTGEK